MAGDYPDTTLYRSPTEDEIAKRQAAAAGAPALQGPYAAAMDPSAMYAQLAKTFYRGDAPPTAAEAAAKASAVKAASTPDNAEGQYPASVLSPPKPPVNYGANNVASIAAGGDPRLLDYGQNNQITGSGSGSKGQFNSFTGFGTGGPVSPNVPQPYDTTPTGFAAARGYAGPSKLMSTGANGAVNSGDMFVSGRANVTGGLDAIRAQIANMHQQAAAFSADGTLRGRLQAAAMYKRAAALGSQLGSEAGLTANLTHTGSSYDLGMQTLLAHQQTALGQLGLGYGQLAHGNRQTNLAEQQAYPGMMLDMAGVDSVINGDSNGLGRIQASRHGTVYGAPTVHQAGLGTLTIDPTSGDTIVSNMQGVPVGRYPRGMQLPTLKPAPQGQ